MRIKTEVCSKHSRENFGWRLGNAKHAYRLFKIGPARRCPSRRDWLTDMLDWDLKHPSIERQTLDEMRRIRQILEQQSGVAKT